MEMSRVRFSMRTTVREVCFIFFEVGSSGKKILHTGDFRACKAMQDYPLLRKNIAKIDSIFGYDLRQSTVYISYTRNNASTGQQNFERMRTRDSASLGYFGEGKFSCSVSRRRKEGSRAPQNGQLPATPSTATSSIHPLRDEGSTNIHAWRCLSGKMFPFFSNLEGMLHTCNVNARLKGTGKCFKKVIGILPTGWAHTLSDRPAFLSTRGSPCALFRALGLWWFREFIAFLVPVEGSPQFSMTMLIGSLS